MKLRNKKTGKIVKLDIHCIAGKNYESLAEINEEWEDYEEPKEFYWINYDGSISYAEIGTMDRTKIKQIGNYFETEEEAEKAVEKLKAWKRLKDKGFRFTGIAGISNNISFESDSKYNAGHIMYDEYSNTDDKLKEYNDDLMLLFGSEE